MAYLGPGWKLRGANKHKKRAQEHRPGKTIPRQRLEKMPRQSIGKLSEAGNWQNVSGRDCKRCPGRALANVLRQRTGKRPTQGAQACPGRARTLANVPRQGTGKRSQAGNWQAFPGRELASVPDKDCKRVQAGNRRCPQAGDSGCSQAGN